MAEKPWWLRRDGLPPSLERRRAVEIDRRARAGENYEISFLGPLFWASVIGYGVAVVVQVATHSFMWPLTSAILAVGTIGNALERRYRGWGRPRRDQRAGSKPD